MTKDRNIIRVQKNKDNPYVMMNKTGLHDIRLSWKAKGLLAYILSLPDDWQIYESELQNHAKDGKDSLKSAMKELMEFGYVVRTRLHDEKGRFNGYDYCIYEVPTENGKPDNGKSVNGKTNNGKSATTNNKNTNNKKTNNDNTHSFSKGKKETIKYENEVNEKFSGEIVKEAVALAKANCKSKGNSFWKYVYNTCVDLKSQYEATRGVQSANKFHNFEQRIDKYDPKDFERIALENNKKKWDK